MRNYRDDLVNRVINLYNMYERYMWKRDNVKLNILIQDKSIGFYLYDDKDELDNLVLTFSGKENNLYKYVSIKILLEMINDVLIYRSDNEFYNNVHKPNLRLIVNDEVIFNIITDLVDKQLLEFINDDMDVIRDIRNSIVNPMFYPNKVISKLDERIGMSRLLLRSEGRK